MSRLWLRWIGTVFAAVVMVACAGPKGDPGVKGDPGSAGGTSCTVADNHNGSSTITCTDGTSATVTNGRNGATCSVHDNGNGTSTITCTDGTSTTVGGAPGSCTVHDNGDGSSTISCTDGSSTTVSNGRDGGTGASCSVTNNGNGTRTITCTDGSSVTVNDTTVDYSLLTADEAKIANMKAVVTGVTIPADGRPVITLKISERHGSGVRGLSATLGSWRFALLKLVPGSAAALGVNGSANDTWVSYMANNATSTTSTESAAASTPTVPSGLTDNLDGTYTYRFTRVINGAGSVTAGTTYDANAIHRLILLLSASSTGTPFSPINVVKEFIPTTGADVTGQNDKVDPASCLECHTQFRATTDGTGETGAGQFHGGVRYDVRTCAACHNDQKRFVTLSSTTVNDSAIGVDGTWTGNLAVLNGEAFVNLPVFIHKIHMGEDLNLKGGTYVGFGTPGEVTYPQDIRNCVKCHRPAAAPAPAALSTNWKDKPSRRACGACHDNVSFVAASNGRKLHAQTATSSGSPQADDSQCLTCHGPGGLPEASITGQHLAISPPNALNVYIVPTPTGANSNTNAAWVAAAGTVPAGAKVPTYVVNKVSTWVDASSTPPGLVRPQIEFKIQINGADVVFADPAAAAEMIPSFVGGPSAYFAFSVPQDTAANHGQTIANAKVAPADFNASGSAYLKNVWNGTGTCATTDPTHAATGQGLLTYDSTTKFYTLQAQCIVIPANAAMLYGGIGYTYSLGSVNANPALSFKTNNLPLTQTDVPGYPFTANPNGFGGIGGIIVPAPDVAKVAADLLPDGKTPRFTARRTIVDSAKCNACHVQLGVGPDFHAGQRNDAQTCNFCHKPNQTSTGWSANMKDFVHGLHSAEKRTTAFTWHEKSLTQGYWQTTYPAILNNCETCHKPGTYDFSTKAMTDALPNMLPSAVGAGTYAALSVHSPYVAEANNYGAVYGFNAVTGASTDAAPTVLITSPIVAACSACHDTPAAVDHMQVNGGTYWEQQSTAFAKPQQEQCLVCHGPNRLASISLVHQDKTP